MKLKQKRYLFSGIISTVLIVLLSVVTIQSFSFFSKETIREQGRMAAELLRISLTEQMLSGVIDQRENLLMRLRAIPGITAVHVVRGDPVNKQFGPGLNSEKPRDEMDRLVLATGKWQERFFTENNEPMYRITIPYIATGTGTLNCLQCHDVPEGTVNGAVTLTFSLDHLKQAEWMSITPIVVLLLIFGLCLAYFLKRLFAPMVATAENLKEVVLEATAGNFSGRIESKTTDEIGEIADSTNLLLETLDQSMGKISSKIQSLGNQTRSFDKNTNLLAHTVNVVEEMVGATRFKQTVENDLNIEEIYSRIKSVVTDHFELTNFSFYEVTDNERALNSIFVGGLKNPADLWCDPDIMVNAEACRCKRTAADVSSIDHDNICPRFAGNSKDMGKMVHVCMPMMLSGHIGGILQLVMSEEGAKSRPGIEQMAQIYLNQAAPVIEARQLMQSLKETAMRDPMTGLYNRRFLEDYIDSMLAGLVRQKASMGILMCDVDFFKKVNDDYGHDVGDEVIKGLSNILAKAVRDADLAIRYGGEEFILLLPHTDEDGAMLLAERIRAELDDFTFQTPMGPLKKTLSIGVSMFPDDGEGFWECVKYSDIALYKAKEGGRNKVLRFHKDMWLDQDEY